MRKRIILITIISLVVVILASFILNQTIIDQLKDAFSLISGLASFVVMILAILLYDKFGIDKSIKEKNLESSLKLLEVIKKTSIKIEGNKFVLFYQVGIVSINIFEDHYKTKLLLPNNYFDTINTVTKFANDLYLPNQIKMKLDKLVPQVLGVTIDSLNEKDYAKVIINNSKVEEWKFNMLNNNEEITLFDYLIKWDDLISTIKEWCEKNSDSKIDLNIK